ncbi:MAG: sigma-70 family RNA polymerase sigma factor [Akkermansiaceae bacterium]|nr:sigma-70 family RNA polymerase sigma factor [Akkermansiaceae bacterium]
MKPDPTKAQHPAATPTDPQHIADDTEARFAYLMMESRDALYRYLFSLHPVADEVDDLLQETAMTLWKKIGEYDSSRDFLPWALRVAYFEVLRWRKHMRKRRFVLSEELVEQLSATSLATPQEEMERARHHALQDCLAKLPGKYRQVVEQRYQTKGTLKDLAAKLGITSHRIYHRLEYARETLASCIERNLADRGFEYNQKEV